MTSPYLQRAYERMKLGVSVGWRSGNACFKISRRGDCYSRYRSTPAEATRTYFDLCDSLSTPDVPLPASGFAAGCSASGSPKEMR